MGTFIVVVEDDHLQEGPLQEQLEDAFPGARIATVVTEQEFRDMLAVFRADPPDIVIMDVMLRWAYPAPGAAAPPPDVVAGGYYRAGLRCAELLLADPALCGVPVVYYTILERSDLERDCGQVTANRTYVRKSADPEVLNRKVRELIGVRR
jgi:CheY-like chemotaxis protein